MSEWVVPLVAQSALAPAAPPMHPREVQRGFTLWARWNKSYAFVGPDLYWHCGAYVTTFSRFSTGAEVRGFAAGTADSWTTSIPGMVLAHSAYGNDIRVRLRPSRLTVWGTESGGKYVAMISTDTGRFLCQRKFE